MHTRADVRPVNRGSVIGLGLGRFVFVGAGVALMLAANCLAAPENARVVAGKATIRQRGDTTVIRAGDRAIIDYSRFNIGRNETVRFIQPRADATVLNRIQSTRPSVIDGTLKSNGRVYLVNPSGILFTENAVVQTRGLVAAAGTISNRDFRAGIDRFTDVRGSVTNAGRVETGSEAVLIGRHVANSGTISASAAEGMVAMIAADGVTLTRHGDTMSVHVARDPGAPPVAPDRPGVDNSGQVKAPRGRSLMLAGDVYSLAARNTGTVRARQISVKGEGDGDVQVSGHLDAAGRGVRGTGGSIEVTGRRVLVENALIDAGGAAAGGDIRIGGDRHGGGDLRRAEATTVDARSRLLADARRSGDGGSVVVWSDGSTRFHGRASASGAGASGDGGFVETSGHALDIRGAKVEARASGGEAGKWLLDPFDVTINASDGTPSGAPPMLDPFTPVADTSIDADDIAAALATTAVEITTGGAGVGAAGNITVANDGAIDYAGGSAATLTLRAANNVVVNAPITTSGGALTVNLLANDSGGGNVDPDPTAGNVVFNFGGGSTGGITSGNGAVNMSGVDVNIAAGSIIDAGSGDIRVTANSAAGQDIGLGAGAAGTLTLTGAELGQFTTTGRVSIDSIDTDAVTSDVTVTTLALGATTYNLAVSGETVTADSITLSADRELDITARAGSVAVNGTLSVAGSAGSIILRGDDVAVGGAASVSAPGGRVVYAANAGVDFELGTAAAGGFRLSQAELDNTTAGTIECRTDGPAGDSITVGTVTLGGATNLELFTTGSIVEAAADSVTDITLGSGTLTLTAGSGIGSGAADGALDTEADRVNISVTDAGDAFLRSNQSVTIGNAATSDGRLSIRTGGAGAADLTVENISANQAMPGSSPTLELIAGGAITSMPAAPGDRIASSGTALFESTRAGDSITIGNADVAGGLSLRTIGGGDITLTNERATVLALADVPAMGNLSVTSRGQITQTGALSVSGTATFRTLDDAGADITLSSAANTFGSLSAFAFDSNNIAAADGSITIHESAANAMVIDRIETSGGVTLRADELTVLTGAGHGIAAGGSGITLEPLDAARAIRVGANDGMSLSLDPDELRALDTTGTVTIGRDGGTGAVTITDAAAIDLSTVDFSLALRGGDITFNQRIDLGGMASSDRQLSLIGRDITSSLGAGVPAFVVDGTRGRVLFDSTGDVTIAGTADQLAARLTTAGRDFDYLNINSALETVTLGAVEGVRVAADGDITIRSGMPITITSGIVTSGTGGVIVNATTPPASVIDNTGPMGTAITVGPGGSIAFDAAGGRVGGVMPGEAFKIDTGAASAGMFAQIVADTGTGINIASAGTGELRAGPLSAADGPISLRHSGALVVNDRVVAGGTGDVTLRAEGNITINAAATMPTVSASTGSISITSDSGLIDVNGEIRTLTGGSISLAAGSNLSVDDMIEATMGDITLSADGSLAINDVVRADPGSVVLRASELTIGSAGQVTATGMGGTGGEVTIARSIDGVIDVGEAGTGSLPAMTPVLHVDNDELNRISAARLTIGDGDHTRLIRVSGVADPDDTSMTDAMRAHDNLGAVVLRAERSTGAITFSGASPSFFTSLHARAAAGIRLAQDVIATTGALSLDADSDATAVPSGSVMDVIGVDSGRVDVLHVDGSRTLRTLGMPTDTDVTLRGRRSTGMDPVTGIFADNNLAIESTHDISIRDHFEVAQTLSLTADNQVRLFGGDGRSIDIRAKEGAELTGNISVGVGNPGTISINADTDGDGGVFSITLDSMSRGILTLGAGSTMRVIASDITLQGNIAGAGADVLFGRSTEGDIRIGAFTDAPGFMTISSAELSRISCRDLTIGNFVSSVPAPAVTNGNTGAITVTGVDETDSDGISGTLRLVAGTDLTFTGAGSTFGALDGQAVGNVVVQADAPLSTVTGRMRLAADQATVSGSAPDAMGILEINAAISTGGNNFAGEGADFILTAALSTAGASGRGDVSLTRPSGGTITVDNSPTTSASRMSISDAELRMITAQNITIGDNARIATVNVRNLSDADTAGIAGQFRVESDNEIVFSGANRVGELVASADQRIDVLGDITTTRGTLRLDANADNDANATNTIEFTGSRTLDSALDIDLTVSGGIIAAETGDLTLRADRNISIFDDLNVSGNLTMVADDQPVSDGQGSITFVSSSADGTDVLVRNGNAVLTAQSITMETDSSLIAALGTVTLNANDAISVAGNITSNGLLTVDAGRDDAATGDNDGAFAITGARFLRANNEGDISIRASSVAIDPSANLVAQRDVLVTRAGVGRIAVGDGLSDTSGLALSASEIGTITARDVIIGDAVNTTAGDEIISRIDVGRLGSADLSTVSRALRLNALGQAGDGGVVEFNATTGQQYGALDVNARTRIRTRGDITAVRGGISLDGGAATPGNRRDGAIILGGDVLTTSAAGNTADVLMAGAVELRRDVTVTAQRDARFFSTVRAPNRRNLLTVNAPREIVFNGDIGRPGADRLYGLSINPRISAQSSRPAAVTRLGGNIYTADENRTRPGAGIDFRDRVVLTRNVTIDDNGARGVFFHERVTPAAAGQQSLSVAVRRGQASPVSYGDVRQIPRIVFGGDVGNRDLPFRSISLNVPSESNAATNGHAHPQALPTIVASRFGTGTAEDQLAPTPTGPGPEFDFAAVESFSMGRNEKMVALGSVDIQVLGAGGTATVGDITALTDIDVRASRINIRGRASGPIFDDGSRPGQPLARDTGVDFVAGNAIRFSTRPQVIEPGQAAPIFGSPNPRPADSNLDGFLYRSFSSPGRFRDALTTVVGSGSAAQTFVVDLAPNGASDTNYIESIAGLIPQESRSSQVVSDPVVDESMFDALNQLGINPRNLSGDELQAALVGWATYNDYPPDPLVLSGAAPRTVSTTVNRLEGTPTLRTLRKFNTLFFGDPDPASDAAGTDQRGAIKAAFDDAVRQFRAAQSAPSGRIDPRALRRFVDANLPEARDYADRLGEILDDLRLLGLVGREYTLSRQFVLQQVRPTGAGWSFDDTELFLHLPLAERDDTTTDGR